MVLMVAWIHPWLCVSNYSYPWAFFLAVQSINYKLTLKLDKTLCFKLVYIENWNSKLRIRKIIVYNDIVTANPTITKYKFKLKILSQSTPMFLKLRIARFWKNI